jgi:hypothetical protein
MVIKVALLFSGQARFFDSESYISIKKFILDKYDCDTFCHFWWDNGVGLRYECSPWNGWNEIPIRSDTFKKINEIYNPKSMKWDFPLARENIDFGYNTIHMNTPYHVRSMYTSLQRVYQLFHEYVLKTNTHYDFVIRIRYDTIITAFPNLNEINNQKLYVPDKYSSRELYPEEKYPGISKICINECWITDMRNAFYLFNIINEIQNLYLITNNISDEQLFTAYIEKLKINVEKCSEDIFNVIVPYKSTHQHLISTS